LHKLQSLLQHPTTSNEAVINLTEGQYETLEHNVEPDKPESTQEGTMKQQVKEMQCALEALLDHSEF